MKLPPFLPQLPIVEAGVAEASIRMPGLATKRVLIPMPDPGMDVLSNDLLSSFMPGDLPARIGHRDVPRCDHANDSDWLALEGHLEKYEFVEAKRP